MKTQSKRISISIDKKLIFLVIGVSVVTISVSGFLSFNSASDVLHERMRNQLTSESTIRGNSILSIIHTRITETQVLATDPMIRKLVDELNHAKYEPGDYYKKVQEKQGDFLIQVRAFQELVGFSIGFEDVKIIGKDGKVFFSLVKLAKTDNFSDDPRFIRGLIGSFATFEPTEKDDSKMIVVIQIFEPDAIRGSEPIGVIIAKMRNDEINEILLNRSSLGESGEVYLVNDDYLMISESRFIENAAFNQIVTTLPVRECFENGNEIDGIYLDYREISILGSSYCAKDLGFVLLAEIDEAETLQPVLVLQNTIFLTGVSITIVMSAIAFLLSKLLSRPIIKLRDAANEIAKGNFDVRTNIKTSDEIGQLSLSFDKMSKNLQESLRAINLREEIIKQQEDILLRFSHKEENSCVCIIDINQSTVITENLSEEQISKFYEIFINSIAKIVKKFNGMVVKNIGDSVLFYFPEISSHDKAAMQNVLECCLTISQSISMINERMIQSELPTIDCRLSISYGTVNVAKVATSLIDDIFGPTVNRCAKINRFAISNSVIIGSDVYEHVKSYNDYNFKIRNVKPVGPKTIFSVYQVTRKIPGLKP
jgi:class 3 adenylate cyclase